MELLEAIWPLLVFAAAAFIVLMLRPFPGKQTEPRAPVWVPPRALPEAGEPYDVLREQLRLAILAGRRCAHDLEHASCEVRGESAALYHERAKLWRDVFYPDNGVKRYRDRLHDEIMRQAAEIARLRKLLADNGIVDEDGDIPF